MDARSAAARPSLRERKKQQTRENIERVALQMFDEKGYDQTTLAEIAEAADVAPRTIFGYFQGKEDIVFSEENSIVEKIREVLAARPEGATTVQTLREFVSSMPPADEPTLIRKRVIAANPELQMTMRAHIGQLDDVLEESIARDLGAGPDDIRPAMIAASMTAAFARVRDRFETAADDVHDAEALKVLDQVFEFLQGGLEALRD